MGDLSKNFNKKEFACKCCGVSKASKKLVDGLQELRDLVDRPITIVSGYRCKKHNINVGGATNSQHVLGNAADIKIDDMTIDEIIDAVEKIDVFKNGGIGRYRSWVHVDVRSGAARWNG